jgi:hypothetical protein
MEGKKNVHVADLYTAFSNIVDTAPGMCIHACMHKYAQSITVFTRFRIGRWIFDCVLEFRLNLFYLCTCR